MFKYVTAVAVLAIACCSIPIDASAAVTKLKGTYTEGQIKSACDKAGGTFYGAGTGKGFGCMGTGGGGSINCTKSDGKCTGYTSDIGAAGGSKITLGQILQPSAGATH